MRQSDPDKPRGILNPSKGKHKFNLLRYFPADGLNFFIEHYWIVKWDLRGEKPYTSETLPHPSIHMVFEKNYSRIFGILKGKFSRPIKDKGKVFGIKFKPGGFYPFIKKNVSGLTNKIVNITDFFDINSKSLEESILLQEEDENMIKAAENFLFNIIPEKDENVLLINNIFKQIISNGKITKVEDLVNKININKRTLQRLFNQYVGVTPKWVIKRYRLHEAVERLASKKKIDWVKFALSLGYFDQAHFIKDFKSIIRITPSEYERKINESKR